MKKYYAGIGSRDTPLYIALKMTDIARLLESYNYILRSGGANGADTAFEVGVNSSANMAIYLPKPYFNDHNYYDKGCIYIDEKHNDYQKAFESIAIHPQGFKLKLGPRNMMIRNYFQAIGHDNQPISDFVICWTHDGANGTTILTSRETGGSGQAIRLAALYDIPVYNLKDYRYENKSSKEIVDIILFNLENNINPNILVKQQTTLLF